ncbi:MAG: SDR family oxidoreductase, partial [Candidatus Helarchaeota archaeon]
MKSQVLIIGASGLVGFCLFELFIKNYKVVGTYYKNKIKDLIHLNLLDKSELKATLNAVKPAIILLPAALPNVEFCETNPEECWKHNVTAPLNLINLIKDTSIKLVYYSTDYIFDGKSGPYSEDDIPNPINVYGKAKLETEKQISKYLTNYLI